jgi:hypothetical protein
VRLFSTDAESNKRHPAAEADVASTGNLFRRNPGVIEKSRLLALLFYGKERVCGFRTESDVGNASSKPGFSRCSCAYATHLFVSRLSVCPKRASCQHVGQVTGDERRRLMVFEGVGGRCPEVL